jgi:N-acetylmuramoyl-L-alanine amidase
MRLGFRNIIVVLLFISAITASAQERVQPVEGDGVYSLLRRHGRLTPANVQEFRELNRGRFTARGELMLGRYYILPPLHEGDSDAPPPTAEQPAAPLTQVVITQTTCPSIFGPNYSDIPLRSNDLRGACFYIISGHGGPDPGAITRIGNRSLHEDEYNYDFALRLARNLMMHGATVHVIIQDANDGIRNERYLRNSQTETCLGEPIPRGQMERLRQRVDAVNRLYEQDRKNYQYIRAIEIHIDSRNPRQQIDLFMYYHTDQPKARETAYTLLREMERQYRRHQPGRGFSGHVSHRNLYILREMRPPTIMVEVGNFQNARDRERILNHNNRQAVANWLTNGLIEDFRNNR